MLPNGRQAEGESGGVLSMIFRGDRDITSCRLGLFNGESLGLNIPSPQYVKIEPSLGPAPELNKRSGWLAKSAPCLRARHRGFARLFFLGHCPVRCPVDRVCLMNAAVSVEAV
jgi:hypothetical protein